MSLAITAVVALVLLLLTIIGAQRDLRRGALTLAATLFGVVLIDLWSESWARNLATLLNTNPQGALSAVQAILLVGSAILLGYGGGVLLSPTPLPATWRRRITGGVMGFLNALILTGYLLRFGASSGASNAALIEGNPIVSVLHNGLPLFFGIIALFGAGAVMVQLGLNAFQERQGGRGATAGRASASGPLSEQLGGPSAAERQSNQSKVLERINQATGETKQK